MKRIASPRRSPGAVRTQIAAGPANAGRGRNLTPEGFARALAGKGLRPVPRKVLLSLRIDADVIDWFRQQGPGYQSRMNALLRAYMEAHQ
jgi:uncharacterized protein (DUF4415 family)